MDILNFRAAFNNRLGLLFMGKKRIFRNVGVELIKLENESKRGTELKMPKFYPKETNPVDPAVLESS